MSDRNLKRAVSFTVTHHACASAMLAIDLAGRLLAADGDPDALALILAGEKAFTRDAQVLPGISVFAEAAAACLVRSEGPRDRILAYASSKFFGRLADNPVMASRYEEEYPVLLGEVIQAAISRAGLGIEEITLVLPHNVNVMSWRKLCHRIGLPVDRVLLDNADRVLRAVGPIRAVSAGMFVECGEVLCVEATQALRFQEVQTYDVFVLRAGAVQFQFSGMIAPRSAALPQPAGGPVTPERRIYDRYRSAAGARDYARLRDLISADAVDIYASFGVARQGRDAILDTARSEARRSSPPRLKAITAVVETPGLIGVEAVVTETLRLPGGGVFGLPGGPAQDLHCYEFLVLRDGAIRCRVLGLISPRPDELEAILTRGIDQTREGQRIGHEAKMRASALARESARHIGNPWWR